MERPPSLLTLPMTPQCGQNAPLGQREASMTLRASSSSVKAGLLRSNSGISGLQNSISTLLLWFSQVHNRQSFGGFVGFQRVTRVKNLKSPLPNFFRRAGLLLDALTTSSGRIPPAGRREGPRAFSRWSRAFTLGGGGV